MAEANQDLHLERGIVIRGAELHWEFGPSGGPGGQHANRAHSRAELRFDLARSASFDDRQRALAAERLGNRVRDGIITIVADRHRSQWRNRQEARRRLRELLDDSLRPEPPRRRPTRPGRAARQRRMDEKRQRSETKRLRKRPDLE